MGAKGGLARAHEQREAHRRQDEMAREDIKKYYGQQRAMDTVSANMDKDEFKRKGREARERQTEQQVLESMYQAERSRELASLRVAEEERVTATLARQLQEQERSQREVQQLREQSAELRELAEKIRLARCAKERSVQLAEKASLAAQEQEYDRSFDQVLMREDAEGLARQRAQEAERREAGKAGMRILEGQMAERLAAQKAAEAEHARERAMVDEVVRRIQAEDAMEAADRRQKQSDTKAYIAAFLAQTEAEKAARREALAEDDRRIQKHWDMVREREAAEAGRQAARQQAADRIYEKLKLEQEAALAAAEEEEYLINLMREEQQAERRRQQEEALAAKREAARRDMLAANQMQMQLKAEREAAARAEEEAYRQRMMAKFAEDDRLEQLNAQKRRLKVAEHKREVDRLVDEKRRMYEEARAAEEAVQAQRQAEEARKASIVEQERRKLLAEAANLREYLPRGVLRDAADLEFVTQTLADSQLRGGGAGRR